MITLLAHHVEMKHVPVLLALFAVGSWLGWSLMSRLYGPRAESNEAISDKL